MGKLLRLAALFGNLLFILWVSFNAIDSGFKGTTYEILSGAGLIVLLALNSILLFSKK
jgi:hypothetical protein